MSLALLFAASLTQTAKAPAAAKAEVNLSVGRDVAPGPKVQLNLNTRNVPVLHLSARPIDGAAWLVRRDLPNNNFPKVLPSFIGPAAMTWDVTVRQKGQQLNPSDNYFSRQVNLPPLKPGVYLITAASGGISAYGVVNVTNLAVVLKRTKSQILAWVTDFRTAQTVPSAGVKFLDNAGHVLSSATTRADGTATLPGATVDGTLVVRHGRDMAGVKTGFADPDGTLRALFQTDRPIYRPGQTVSYKAILRWIRGEGYDVAGNVPVRVTMRDARDNPLDQAVVAANAMGSVAGSFQIPEEGITGPYSLVIETNPTGNAAIAMPRRGRMRSKRGGVASPVGPSPHQVAYQTFTVAAYRKPEFKVDVTPSQRRFLAGDKIRFQISAAYYFGAPVQQAQIHWVARSSDIPYFTPAGSERWFYGGDGNLYPHDEYSADPFTGEGDVVTDNDGRATVELKSDPAAGDRAYTLTAIVTDNSRREVTGDASVPAYAANSRIGITSPASVVPLGKLIPLQLDAEDLDGHAAAADVTLKLIESVYDQKTENTVDKLLTQRTVHVPPSGKLITDFPALAQGDLRIDAAAPDGTGRTAKTGMTIYVAGPKEQVEPDDQAPIVSLKLDKRIYGPGDTANIYATTNHPKGPILVVEEGREIFAYAVLPPGRSTRQWSVPISSSQSPNAWVTACEWIAGSDVSTNEILPVPDLARQLTVTARPERTQLEPGDHQRVRVTTTDRRGRPVPAEVALAVIDEAIYAIASDTTPDPYRFYWGMRENLVSTATSAPEESEGGAFQRTNSIAPIRSRFVDTAYWNPFIDTGPDGSAVADFETPGNLTTWRTTARAVTASTQVGSATASFVATRPLTLRMAAPTLVAQGDEFTLIGTLNNQTGQPIEERVFLAAMGIAATGQDQTVTVPAHGTAEVHWKLTADSVPKGNSFSLTARAEGPNADLSDALKVIVPVVPRGVRETALAAGSFVETATTTLDLPPDTIPDGSSLEIRAFAGVRGVIEAAGRRVLDSARYGSPAAADALMVAAAESANPTSSDVREAMALLSRTQLPDGWGWWENAPSDPIITAEIGHALVVARKAGLRVFDSLWSAAQNGAWAQYGRTNLWEARAQLAATMLELDRPDAVDSIKEVRARGVNLSPYARLRMAEALAAKDRAAATVIVNDLLPLVSDGPGSSYLPVGEGIGWVADETQTTAELLTVLALLKDHEELQRKLANYLSLQDGHGCGDDDAAVVRALALFAADHPVATQVGTIKASVSGKDFMLRPSSAGASQSLVVKGLPPPTGPIRLTRIGSGEVMYAVELHYYRRLLAENATGVRVSRRYELRNAAGIWTEVSRAIRPGEPVRCTVVVWGDDLSDALRVTEPIPSGFQFVDAEETAYGYQDVRDGAVVHYLSNTGAPVYFRYYLRAEADGKLIALPATAEYLRRPASRGNSAATKLEVHP